MFIAPGVFEPLPAQLILNAIGCTSKRQVIALSMGEKHTE